MPQDKPVDPPIKYSFWVKSKKAMLNYFNEPQDIGFIEYRVYESRRSKYFQGCGGRLMEIELNNGIKFETDDLWCIMESWQKELPKNAQTGTIFDKKTNKPLKDY